MTMCITMPSVPPTHTNNVPHISSLLFPHSSTLAACLCLPEGGGGREGGGREGEGGEGEGGGGRVGGREEGREGGGREGGERMCLLCNSQW